MVLTQCAYIATLSFKALRPTASSQDTTAGSAAATPVACFLCELSGSLSSSDLRLGVRDDAIGIESSAPDLSAPW